MGRKKSNNEVISIRVSTEVKLKLVEECNRLGDDYSVSKLASMYVTERVNGVNFSPAEEKKPVEKKVIKQSQAEKEKESIRAKLKEINSKPKHEDKAKVIDTYFTDTGLSRKDTVAHLLGQELDTNDFYGPHINTPQYAALYDILLEGGLIKPAVRTESKKMSHS